MSLMKWSITLTVEVIFLLQHWSPLKIEVSLLYRVYIFISFTEERSVITISKFFIHDSMEETCPMRDYKGFLSSWEIVTFIKVTNSYSALTLL